MHIKCRNYRSFADFDAYMITSVDSFHIFYTGYYVTGDGAHRIDGKYYRITGRMDDVINTSGHRIGTAEIEDVMVRIPQMVIICGKIHM
jgi:acyl-coenzyme A synthetase/AMP-(fatty) acid ligase